MEIHEKFREIHGNAVPVSNFVNFLEFPMNFCEFPLISLNFLRFSDFHGFSEFRESSFPFISFHFFSFPFISFHFLIFPFISFYFFLFPFISFHFLLFPFMSCRFRLFLSLSLHLLASPLIFSFDFVWKY